jgi:hypothetical protein
MIAAALVVWLLGALALGATGLPARLRPPQPQLLLVGLTLLLLVLFARAPAIRTWALALDVRALVAFHLTRLVGFYFLWLHGQGELPWAFAVPGGVGDIAVALVAIGLILWAPRRGIAGWRAYWAWNLAGLADIALVVLTAARLALADPPSMGALLRLPLWLLISYVVPIIIATHVVIFVRLARSRRAGFGPI